MNLRVSPGKYPTEKESFTAECLQKRAKTLQAKVQSFREPMIAMLGDLVHLESPSKEPQATSKCLKFLCDVLADLAFLPRVIQGAASAEDPLAGKAGHLLALPRQRKRKPIQLLLGHVDTVWPTGTLAHMPFLRNKEKICGPGVFDMKGGIIQMVFALKAIQELGWEMALAPVLFLNTDEEIGSRTSRPIIEKLAKRSERVMVLEPALGLDGQLKTRRKGGASFEALVLGKAAHAGLNPQAGASAILGLSFLVQNLFALNNFERGISVNVGMVEGGVQPNMIAPESRAVIDVRVLNSADGAEVEAAIMALKPQTSGVEYRIRKRGSRPPMEATPANQAFWKHAQLLGQALGLELEQGTAGGGSDGCTTSLYTATLDGLGPVGDGAHAVHEHLLIEPWLQRTALLAMLLTSPSLS